MLLQILVGLMSDAFRDDFVCDAPEFPGRSEFRDEHAARIEQSDDIE